jgi:hypothetical protein
LFTKLRDILAGLVHLLKSWRDWRLLGKLTRKRTSQGAVADFNLKKGFKIGDWTLVYIIQDPKSLAKTFIFRRGPHQKAVVVRYEFQDPKLYWGASLVDQIAVELFREE